MKTLILLILTTTITSCTTKNKFGECYGLANKEDIKKETLVYDYSTWNVFLGIIMSGSTIVPINVVGFNLICPIGEKK